MFALPPVHAVVLANPEVMGLSSGGHFVVTAAVVAPSDVPALLGGLGVAPTVSVVVPLVCDGECGPGECCMGARTSDCAHVMSREWRSPGCM